MIIVDTSVLVDYLRGNPTAVAERLAWLEKSGAPYAIPLLCCQELLHGARDEHEWDQLEQYLAVQRLLPGNADLEQHRSAARIHFDCRRQGVTVRAPSDCLIAQQTMDADATLLHDDRDFDLIATVRPLSTWRGE